MQMHSSEVAMAMDYITMMRLTSIENPPLRDSFPIRIRWRPKACKELLFDH